MKSLKVKALIAILTSCLFFSVASAARTYETREDLEAHEGVICEAATDGCNDYFFTDNAISGGTLKLCTNHTPAWKCTKYVDDYKTYPTQAEFEAAEGKICKNATDGCNTFFMNADGTVWGWTLKLCADQTPEWRCTNYLTEEDIVTPIETGTTDNSGVTKYKTQEAFEKAEGLTCSNATDSCNTFFMTTDWKVGWGTLMACPWLEEEEWYCVNRDPVINVLKWDDLATYLQIKSGKLNSKAMLAVKEALQIYTDKLSKMSNEVKKNNMETLVVSIEKVITEIEKERYSNSRELKINVLKLLKYYVMNEINVVDEAIEQAKADEKVAEENKAKMHPSWDADGDWINDCEKEWICDDSVDYTLPRTFEYACDNSEKFFVTVDWDKMTLNDNKTKRFYYLDRTASADWERFVELDETWKELNMIWLKWDYATFQRDGEVYYTNCNLAK